MSPIHGTTYPIASIFGLGKAIARPFMKSDSVLGAAIEKVGRDLGAEVHTLGDLTKAAAKAQAVPVKPEAAPLEVGLGDRLRAWMIGMDPQKLVRLRKGFSSMSDVFQALQKAKVA